MSLAIDRYHDGCSTCGSPTDANRDAARRISDEITLHLTAQQYHATEATNRWIAVRLDDGVSDHQLYDTKDQAMLHGPKILGRLPQHCLYLQIPLTGMPPSEALHVLSLFRQPWLDTTAPVDDLNPFAAHPLSLPRGVQLS